MWRRAALAAVLLIAVIALFAIEWEGENKASIGSAKRHYFITVIGMMDGRCWKEYVFIFNPAINYECSLSGSGFLDEFLGEKSAFLLNIPTLDNLGWNAFRHIRGSCSKIKSAWSIGDEPAGGDPTSKFICLSVSRVAPMGSDYPEISGLVRPIRSAALVILQSHSGSQLALRDAGLKAHFGQLTVENKIASESRSESQKQKEDRQKVSRGFLAFLSFSFISGGAMLLGMGIYKSGDLGEKAAFIAAPAFIIVPGGVVLGILALWPDILW